MSDENSAAVEPHAIIEREEGVMVITMNRPKRLNALSGAMLIRMLDAYREASQDDDIRCIIVTGSGGNFSSGADLKAMSGMEGDPDPGFTPEELQKRMAEDPDLAYKALLRHYRPTKPIIAAVEGVAIAGGTEILQAMDIRVAGEGAKFWRVGKLAGRSIRWAARLCVCAVKSPTRTPPTYFSPASTSRLKRLCR